MDGKHQTAFQQELNRLNFLASIASGPKLSEKSPIDIKLSGKTTVNVSSSHSDMRNVNTLPKGIQQPGLLNNINGNHMTKKRATTNSPLSVSNNSSKTSAKENSYFVNYSSASSSNSPSTPVNILSIQQHQLQHQLQLLQQQQVQQRLSSPTASSTQLNIISASPQSSVIGNTALLTTNSYSSTNQVNNNNTTPLLTKGQQQQQLKMQNNIVYNTVSSTAAANAANAANAGTMNHQINSPIIVSQATNNLGSTKILPQAAATTSTGQTILLPANFAGMYGRLFFFYYFILQSGNLCKRNFFFINLSRVME